MHCTIDINGNELHYDVSGQGPAIVLMHGWGCRASTLDSIARVAALTHTVYNLDFPGFGDSPEPEDVWGVDEYTRLVEAFVSKLGIERPSLLGHSFGGRVAILYSSRNAVDKVVLVDAAGVKPRRTLRYYFKVYTYKALKKIWHFMFSREKYTERLEAWSKKHSSADYRSATPKMRAILSKVVNEDLRRVMPEIKAPTLLVWGENDTATPMRDAKIMERLIPASGLVSFPNCGHYSFLDNPQQFQAVLHSFLCS